MLVSPECPSDHNQFWSDVVEKVFAVALAPAVVRGEENVGDVDR